MKSFKLTALFVVLFLASVVGYMAITDDETETLEIIGDEGEVIESPTERTWNEDVIGDEIELHSDIRDSVYRAMGFDFIDGSIFVTDFGDMGIKRFDLEGRYLRSYGGGEGEGPGEFELIIDLAAINSDTLLVMDAYKREMMGFDRSSGDLLFTETLEYEPYRITSVGTNFIVHATLTSMMFKKYNLDMERQSEFGRLIQDQVQNSIAVSGDLVSAGDDQHFIFAPSRTSFLFYFDLEGEEIRRVIAPDRIGIQKPEQLEDENVRVTRPNRPPVRVYDLYTYEGKLYVSAIKRNENYEVEYSFLDVYDISSGMYQESIRMPTIVGNIIITEGQIYYTDFETEVVKAYQFAR